MVDEAESLKAAARLRLARERAGYGEAKEAAEAFGWPYSAYKGHELGKDRPLTKKAARRYAAVFQSIPATREVTAGWLLLGESPPSWAEREHRPPKRVAIRTVPKVSYAQAAKLDRIKNVEELGVVAIGADPSLGPRAVALDIVGESMVAVPPNGDVSFRPGDTIIVDPDAAYRPGDFVTACIDGNEDAVFRKYRAGGMEKGKEIIDLVPLNENYEKIRLDSRTPGRITGKMVRHIRRF